MVMGGSSAGLGDLEAPVLDHRIGEQAVAEQFQLGACRGGIGGFELHLDRLADAQAAHPFHPEPAGGGTGGLTGRIENRRAQGDLDTGVEEGHRQQGFC